MTPFDFVKSINSKSPHFKDLDDYVPFVVNRALSFSADAVMLVNYMNQCPTLSFKLQYDFLFHSIRQRKRFDKWIKEDKSDSALSDVQSYFKLSKPKAREALRILTPTQLEEIKMAIHNGQ